jgi:hypothetical protein
MNLRGISVENRNLLKKESVSITSLGYFIDYGRSIQMIADSSSQKVRPTGQESVRPLRIVAVILAVLALVGFHCLTTVPAVAGAYTYDAPSQHPSPTQTVSDVESAELGRVSELPDDRSRPQVVSVAAETAGNAAGVAARPAGVADSFVSEAANSGKGTVWRAPGSSGNAGTVRIMEPTAQYPEGYVRFYNDSGQPIGLNGQPGPNSMTHIPLNPDGTYPLPKNWGG